MRLDKFFNDFVDEKLINTHVAFIGKITGNVRGASPVSSGKMCDLQPLFLYKEIAGSEEKHCIIKNVPISQSTRKIEYYEYMIEDHIIIHPTHGEEIKVHECDGTLTKVDESQKQLQSNVYGGHIKVIPFKEGDIVICLCCDRNIDEVRKGILSLPSAASVHEISNCVVVGYLL